MWEPALRVANARGGRQCACCENCWDFDGKTRGILGNPGKESNRLSGNKKGDLARLVRRCQIPSDGIRSPMLYPAELRGHACGERRYALPWSTLGPMGRITWLLSTSALGVMGRQYIVFGCVCKGSYCVRQPYPHRERHASGHEKQRHAYTENNTSPPEHTCAELVEYYLES